MKSIRDLEFEPGTRVLVRIDVNEPIDEGGIPQDTFRLEKMVPTIHYLRERDARVVLMAHLGKPQGRQVPGLRLDYIAKELARLADCDIRMIDGITGPNVEQEVSELSNGQVGMLQNIRFEAGEEQNSDKLALELSKLGDIYVNEAFSVSHRAHASVVAITKYLPSYAGLLLAQEIQILTDVVERPARPAVAVIGGAKIETKLPVIEVLQDHFDTVLVGGKIANEYLDTYKTAQKPNVILPVDFANEGRSDLGEQTVAQFSQYLETAKTIVWNGPLGWVEKPPYDKSTKAVAEMISKNEDSYSVMGGGETVDEIKKLGKETKIDFISTGGGAMLEFIAKEGQLPGIKVLG